MTQLEIDLPPETFTFILVCPYCGARGSLEEVDDDRAWDRAVKWGYLAQKAHEERDCPRAPKRAGSAGVESEGERE